MELEIFLQNTGVILSLDLQVAKNKFWPGRNDKNCDFDLAFPSVFSCGPWRHDPFGQMTNIIIILDWYYQFFDQNNLSVRKENFKKALISKKYYASKTK